MNRTLGILALYISMSSISFAGEPVASVSSTQPLTIGGHSVSAPGVSSWPLAIGDELHTSSAPGSVLFSDGSTVTLAAHSWIKLEGSSESPKVILMAGNLDYSLVPKSAITLSKEEIAMSPSSSPSGSSGVSTASTVGRAASAGGKVAGVAVAHSSAYYLVAGTLAGGATSIAANKVVSAVSSGPSQQTPVSPFKQ